MARAIETNDDTSYFSIFYHFHGLFARFRTNLHPVSVIKIQAMYYLYNIRHPFLSLVPYLLVLFYPLMASTSPPLFNVWMKQF